ncbi:hypothetical protein K466DRAFT_607254 [Polyporus arcularius HHB13444]|uniref:Uncharacterized protein n=1 Tax=Polyporus arcularius HHB13444 TaxID=1314778 RepID=A0A5C3NLS0_9APHY|nr:hypothetical protein K466DRAFT_607254 [Polyporus arcularius HHB13444]
MSEAPHSEYLNPTIGADVSMVNRRTTVLAPDDPSALIDLYNSKDLILSPFHGLTASRLRFNFIWAIESQEDGHEVRHVLCHRRQEPTPPRRQPNIPLLWDMIGEVTRDDFALSARGVLGRSAEEVREAPMASGWLQQRPNKMSDINWRALRLSIRTLTDSIPAFEVDTSTLLRITEEGLPQLKLTWQGFIGETTDKHLPLFGAHGDRRIPTSVDDFPFGEAFHALFSIDLYRDPVTGHHHLTANLIRLIRA